MKNILDKINRADEIQANKVELGTHEVELALIDDLKEIVAKGKQVQGSMVEGQLEVKNIAQRTLQFAKEHLKNLDNVSKLSNQMKTQADGLGIDITKVAEYRSAFDFLNSNPKAATEVIIKKLESLK
jgi:hypothetical protein